jgi:hypothetical protein
MAGRTTYKMPGVSVKAISIWNATFARTSGRRILGVGLVALCVSCVTSVSAIGYVDGISDQNLPHWNGASNEESSFEGSYFANLFHTVWVGGSPAAHIKYARWVVQWNVMGNTSSEQYKNFQAWYRDVKNVLGLTPEIALANYEGALPSSPAEYRVQLAKILAAFPVPDVEAWNEPNHSGVSASAAASYWKEAHSACQELGCTAIAGDFLDERYPEEHMVGYEREYKTALDGANPENWGIHPYSAIKYRTKAPIEAFKANLPSSSDHIWFTEAGAYLCQVGVGESTEAEQKQGAEYLTNTLMPTFSPTHVFYYYFMYAWNEETPCASYTNSSLYKPNDTPRSAASVIYGGAIPTPAAPAASTGVATGVSEEQANLNGTVDPNATETHYYFQYGPTASYGDDAPALPGGSAGAGSSAIPVSTTISGLEEGAMYHYRLVAESYWGTSYGGDQVVTTGGYPVTSFYAGSGDTLQENWWNGSSWGYVNITAPIGSGSSPATDPFPNIGQYDVYFRGSGGELEEDYYGGESGWHLIPLGHAVEAGTTPSIRHPQVGGETVVYYAGSGDTLQESWWTGSQWDYYNVNVSIAAGSSPAADPHPLTGQDDVYFRGSGGELEEDYYGGESGWHLIPLGHAMAAGTTPTVVHPRVGGTTYVFYVGSNGILQESWWNGAAWQWASLGATVESGTSPAGL